MAPSALGMSQPAVTQAMRELELSVDAPLLQRGTAGVELTVYGRSLVRRASVIQREMERAVAVPSPLSLSTTARDTATAAAKLCVVESPLIVTARDTATAGHL